MTTLSRSEMLRSFQRQMADVARGERLRDLRERRHLSQEDAAHEIGVTARTLGSWERGGPIRWDNAKRAGAFYSVDPQDLVTRDTAEGDPYAVEDVARLIEIDAKLTAILAHLGIDYLDELAPQRASDVREAETAAEIAKASPAAPAEPRRKSQRHA